MRWGLSRALLIVLPPLAVFGPVETFGWVMGVPPLSSEVVTRTTAHPQSVSPQSAHAWIDRQVASQEDRRAQRDALAAA